MTAPLLSIRDLVIEAETSDGQWRRIVDGVSLDTARGEVLGLIGESGAGKSTIGLAALGYARHGCRLSGGQILLDGQDIRTFGERQLLDLRGRRVAYVAQSAAAAFNPAHTLMAIPTLIFALLILSVLGTSIPVLILVIAVLDSTRVFRLARSLGVNIVTQDFVEVARLRGERLPWVLVREILPNAAPPLVAEFGLRFCFVFLFISALSFLGLGIQPPNADWGGMVRENAQAINFGLSAPLIPAAAIAVLTIAVNLVVDWLLARRHRAAGGGR